MKIELKINKENKIFYTDMVPNRAKRKYLEMGAKTEKKVEKDENYVPSMQEQMDEEDEIFGILANTVFDGQFTVDQLHDGAESEYIYAKVREAVFGEPAPEDDDDSGNNQGE